MTPRTSQVSINGGSAPSRSNRLLMAAVTALLIGSALVTSSGASAQSAQSSLAQAATPTATASATCAAPAAATPAATMAATALATEAAPAATADAAMAATMTATEAAQSSFTKINLNTATAEQLNTIPGFTPRWVREFQEYRPYASILVFRKELGKYTDATQIAEWEKYVYVPVQVDNSDAATLMQIPCVDEALAKALIAGRPYKTNDAFLAALSKSLTPDQVALAKNYLEAQQ